MKKPLFNKVAIVGVGLIGGSIGMAVKKRRLAKWVVGVARRAKTAKQAVAWKAVDVATLNLKEGVKGADLIVLCTPVSTIVRLLPQIRRFAPKGTLVLDVGSVKGEICRVGRKEFKNRFGGSHPMAGSHETGLENADPDLFEGETCFSTSFEPGVAAFWRRLGSKVISITPHEHDDWVAESSHLPHVLSFALFHQFPIVKIAEANPSIRGLNRLSKSDPSLWADIALWNSRAVSISIRKFQKSLSEFDRALKTRDRAKLIRFIRDANRRTFRMGPK